MSERSVTLEILLCGDHREQSEPVDHYELPIRIFGNQAQSQGAGSPSSQDRALERSMFCRALRTIWLAGFTALQGAPSLVSHVAQHDGNVQADKSSQTDVQSGVRMYLGDEQANQHQDEDGHQTCDGKGSDKLRNKSWIGHLLQCRLLFRPNGSASSPQTSSKANHSEPRHCRLELHGAQTLRSEARSALCVLIRLNEGT